MPPAFVAAVGLIVLLTGINGYFDPRDGTRTAVLIIALGAWMMYFGLTA